MAVEKKVGVLTPSSPQRCPEDDTCHNRVNKKKNRETSLGEQKEKNGPELLKGAEGLRTKIRVIWLKKRGATELNRRKLL